LINSVRSRKMIHDNTDRNWKST